MSGHFDNEDLEQIALQKIASAFAPGDPQAPRSVAMSAAHGASYGGPTAALGSQPTNNANMRFDPEGERIKLDAPFKLARARLESGEWLLKIELLDPALLAQFQQVVQRGANTFDMHELSLLRNLVDGVLEKPQSVIAPKELTVMELHVHTFEKYTLFQAEKEKVMPLREMKFHMALGLAGELLELMESYEIEDPQKRRENTEEELGDTLFFLTGIRRHYLPGTTISNTWADNSDFAVQPNAAALLINRTTALIDLIKKDLISGKPVDTANFHIAIAAVECFIAQLAKSIGLQMYQLADSNMAKLNKRYRAKFTEAEAAARADKIEAAGEALFEDRA